jgi:DNA-binding NtrC family response regulator/tetratricopeptide (TPR) repeat protein
MATGRAVDKPPSIELLRKLYEDAKLTHVIDVIEDLDSQPDSLQLILGMALFDHGDATRCLEILRNLTKSVPTAPTGVRFGIELARLTREAAFCAASDTAANLACLRQLATTIGDPTSLAGLHLAVAKIEALRGSSLDAGTHVEIARRLAAGATSAHLSCSIDLIAATLDMYTGRLERSIDAAKRGFDLAGVAGLKMQLAGSLANLGLLALCSGNADKARYYLDEGRRTAGELSFVQLALVDSLANVALFEGNIAECRKYLDEAAALIKSQRVPARSWYDLAHQITCCLYLSHMRDWQGIIDVITAAEPELERRQLRVWHTSLLSAKAKAQARLGAHDEANATLLAALRLCPRGAVDPLITVEAATGTCLVLRGDVNRGMRHFDRALRACRAISHKFQEWTVTTERLSLPTHTRVHTTTETRRAADTEETNLILADISTMLGAGHSIDVMAQRIAAVIATTPLQSRLTVTSEYVTDPSTSVPVSWETSHDHSHRIILSDADRRVILHLRDVCALEDVSLVRHLVDIANAAVSYTGDGTQPDEELLWPQVALPRGGDSVFWSPRMQEFLRIAMRLAGTELPILITGETGTGKEVVARLIHTNSKWARGPFVPFNASAIPRDLVESQMFGHRRGAFTGAMESSGGVIRAAEHGTLFLDEIGDLDPLIQPKLLRFLESGEIHPVGEPRPSHTRVRVVAATNAHLESLVAQGRFRSDLLYRLRIATLSLPPLRERKDEIPALAALFVRKACEETGRQRLSVADDFIAALLLHDWPGNIRQLANEIRRVVALSDDGATVTAYDLSPDVAQGWATRLPGPLERTIGPAVTVSLDQPLDRAIDDVERAFLERALTQTRGHVSDAARLLGISRKGLFLKRKKLGLE